MRRFEDIHAWQKARELVRSIYDVSGRAAFTKDSALRDQSRKAAVSIMSNIAEGFARRTHREFTNFLTIARGSAAELQSQLYVALDLGYVTEEKFHDLSTRTEEVSRMIQGLRRSLSAAAGQGERVSVVAGGSA